MKNLKISAKLMVGFGSALVFVILLGMLSLNSMGTLNTTTQGFAKTSIPAVDSIWTVRRGMVSMQRGVLNTMQSKTKEDKDKANNSVIKDRDSVFTALDTLVSLIPEYKEQAEQLKKEINSAASIRQQIYDLTYTLLPENDNAAYSLYLQKYVPLFDECAVKIMAMYNDIEGRVTARAKNADDTFDQTKLLIIVALVVVVVLTVVESLFITKSIKTPIKEIESAAKKMSQGDFNVSINYRSKDELGMLVESFVTLRDVIFKLVEKINIMSTELEGGDIEAKINEAEFNGEYRNLASAVNSSISLLVNDVLKVLSGFSMFGEGNFNATLPVFPGKKVIANEYFDKLKANLSSLNTDVNALINAAIDGKLDARIDAGKYKGDWNALTQGLNNLLQAVSTPINEANAVLAQLSKGDFNVSINKNYKGSFADMTNAFDTMVTAIGSYINEITKTLTTLSSGDLRASINREYLGQFNLIKDSINSISRSLRTTMGDIKVSADNVLGGAKQISTSAMDIANGANVQASSVEELNASILSINEKTHKTANDAQYADDLSKKSMTNAQIGNGEMTKMLTSMQEIKDASSNVSKIMKVIDDIAFQTSLLALNAAVEAARAGEHGTGFAVVAQEVRSLASRSQQAAKETSVMIEDIMAKINDGTSTAKLTAQSLSQIIADINLVSDTVGNIYTATKEQTEGISQITIGINQISDVVQRNASTSEEAAAAAEELNSQSEVLAQMVSSFTV